MQRLTVVNLCVCSGRLLREGLESKGRLRPDSKTLKRSGSAKDTTECWFRFLRGSHGRFIGAKLAREGDRRARRQSTTFHRLETSARGQLGNWAPITDHPIATTVQVSKIYARCIDPPQRTRLQLPSLAPVPSEPKLLPRLPSATKLRTVKPRPLPASSTTSIDPPLPSPTSFLDPPHSRRRLSLSSTLLSLETGTSLAPPRKATLSTVDDPGGESWQLRWAQLARH
jgi:hypothetical protein